MCSAASREQRPNQHHEPIDKSAAALQATWNYRWALQTRLVLSRPPDHLLDSHELPGVVVQAQVDTAKGASTQQLSARPVHRPCLWQLVAVALLAKCWQLLASRVCTILIPFKSQ